MALHVYGATLDLDGDARIRPYELREHGQKDHLREIQRSISRAMHLSAPKFDTIRLPSPGPLMVERDSRQDFWPGQRSGPSCGQPAVSRPLLRRRAVKWTSRSR